MDISGHFSFQEMTGMEYFNEILSGRAYWSVWSNFLPVLFERNDISFVPEISFGEDAILMVQLLYHTQKVVAFGTAHSLLQTNRVVHLPRHNPLKDTKTYGLTPSG